MKVLYSKERELKTGSYMEKRRSKRKTVNLETAITFNGVNYAGFVENMCDHGLHIIASSGKRVTSFIPENKINLKFSSSSSEKINLHCEVRWVHINKTPIHGLMYRMGLEIVETPQ
jgi:hypothetical protein